MTLSFPNPCRSFEPRQDRVRFWGHDDTLEITFLLEGTALRKLCPGLSADEAGVLGAFDSAIAGIHKGAKRAYESARDQSGIVVLTERAF